MSVDTADCIEWDGARSSAGYGQVRIKGTTLYVHRLAYEESNGPIPPGLSIDHLCRNPPCINPDHLEAVTQRENCLRGESPFARSARKTHCIRGHPLSGSNLRIYYDRKGRRARYCRACQWLRDHQRRRKGATMTSDRIAASGSGGGGGGPVPDHTHEPGKVKR